jgi:hypothetical protein
MRLAGFLLFSGKSGVFGFVHYLSIKKRTVKKSIVLLSF